MSVRQYESFLVDCFLDWAKPDIRPGLRYQFKSPDADNAYRLHQAFLAKADAQTIEINGVFLPFVSCSGICLIPVLHDGERGVTENYISFLRDKIAGRDHQFAQAALIIIHNSLLDTLINSADDVGASDAIWHPKRLVRKLEDLIDQRVEGRELSRCLLKDQLSIITEEDSTVFGFAPLYKSLTDGVLEFGELGLFNDPLILNMKGKESQIRRRLEENRALHREIEFAVEHFSGQYENVLKDFSAKFIREHFIERNDWNGLDYQAYLNEATANQEQKMALDDIEVIGCTLNRRAKSQTKAGQKELGLLIEVPAGLPQVTVKLTFIGSDLEADQIRISHNKRIEQLAQITVTRAGGKRSRANVILPYDGQVTFFSIELKRENRSEDYKFRCLMVEQGHFYLEEFKNRFRVDPRHGWLTLLMEENNLRIQGGDGETIHLDEGDECVDCQQFSIVDFEQLANQTEMIQFTLKSGHHLLRLNVEGPAAEEGITLPLLFDKERFGKLFIDDYNAEFNRAKCKIIIDNSEISVVGSRQQMLMAEARLVDELLLFVGPIANIKLDDIQGFCEPLHFAYKALFDYLARYKTLPSLVAWGDVYRTLAQNVVDAYEAALLSIPRHEVLGQDHKRLMRIGIYFLEGKERITPLHPLVLSYHLNLVCRIDVDDSGSFGELPSVTRERLVTSGLLPFIYSSESDFSHVLPVRENQFWLELVPQKQASHSYVQRLVKDKLAEFTEAYASLFRTATRSALIINAIHQAEARELFLGLVDHFKLNKEESSSIHVNFYDDALSYNDFDRFAETASYDEIKSWLGLTSGDIRAEADMLIDVVRSRLTYSKFCTPRPGEPLAYAHLAFFSNNAPVDCRAVYIEEAASGVLCDGLIAGEASETKEMSYFTAFGLRGVHYEEHQHLRLARLIGTLFQPARQSNAHNLGMGIGLAVGNEFKELIGRSYDSALWTTIIDPKVTLDFFANQQDVVLIHYSDQYTSAAGYDAITVTKQVELFKSLLRSDNLLSEFNAFNGEWLLKMLTANSNERKEKNGIIGAYKFVSSILRDSDITWVPLSVAEMLRVSGNVGLKMSDSEFSRNAQGYRRGAISDDVLFVGFKGEYLYLLPLEVKTGARPDFAYAGKQAAELKRYLTEEVLGPSTLASTLYRGLFVRQVMMQVEKLRLYHVLSESDLSELMTRRDWWLRGQYKLADLDGYASGFVVAHVENDSCFEPVYNLTDSNILQVELPFVLLDSLINAKTSSELDALVKTVHVPDQYRLRPEHTGSALAKMDEARVQAKIETKTTSSDAMTNMAEKTQTPSLPLKVLFGHEVLRNTPLYWEPTNTAKFMNTNTGIIGTMGTGKTQFTKSVITQLVRNQSNNVAGLPIGMLIFDYKSDYVDDSFIKATSAKKYRLHRLPYNPLSLYGDMPMLPVHTATGFAETMARAFGLGQKQQLRLRKLILDAYEISGISRSDSSTWSRPAPTIQNVWDLFINQEKVEEDSLYAALDSLASYEIFESDTREVSSLYDLIERVTVIELAGYSIQIQNLVVALTLDLFYSQMQKKGKPIVQGDFRQITKMIFVDEADNFMSQDFSSLRKILKEGREYGVGVILSTQDITHFKTGENNYASYVLTWIVHRVSEIKNADIKSIFNIDDRSEQEALMESVRKLEKHCSIFIDGNKRFQKIRDFAFWELLERSS
ncbi:DNA phosphorothioation-dependent restriction protein DptH [Azonexus sp. IMCC34842]|uniref:DNA phosphorothioation-dependent restriction protein DptH n=1 Tax=Azonexus sp. IMCC34842 TaxID=3420950 RepID=UPI003D14B4E9